MIWFLIFICLVSLLSIFLKNYRKELSNRKLRVFANKPAFEPISKLINQGQQRREEGIKRRNLDYKKINNTFDKADLFYAQDNFKEAEKTFVEVLTLNPEHLDANNKLGLIYLKTNRFSKAEAVFKQLITLEPRNPVYYSNLGLAFYNQNKLLDAKDAYDKSIMLDSKKANRLLSLGKVCQELKYWKPAINAYSKALELNPKNFELYFVITDLLIRVQAFEEALAFINTYLNHNPYDQKAKDILREIKIKAGTSPLLGSKSSESDQKGQNQLFE